MKLTNTLSRLKVRFLTKYPINDIYLNSLISICALCFISICLWIGGASITWEGYAPLTQPEKRLYVILFLFLIWALKFLLIDLDAPNPLQYKDPLIRKKLLTLQSRFHGALQFLKKTTVTRQGQSVHLDQLPWYLLIGPENAGKTALLAHADISFILQRQLHANPDKRLQASKHCDWWVTRDINLVDVPGHYITTQATKNQSSNTRSLIWTFFLRLIKQLRGKQALKGIILALPLPEIMQDGDPKRYQILLHDVFQRLSELQQIFPQPLPCYLIITKCDLLTGFNEFFADAVEEDITQTWGVSLPRHIPANEKIESVFTTRFNALIKRLNQQLISRLHQERNPTMRPYIKEFPLQVERIKEFTFDFIKRFSNANFKCNLQGIYLTSAMQPKQETKAQVIDEDAHANSRTVQLFKPLSPTSRPYFTKQLLSQTLVATHGAQTHLAKVTAWKSRFAYAVSIMTIIIVSGLLGKDFQRGVKQSYTIQNKLTDYQLSLQQFQNPDEHLKGTLALLNSLQQSEKNVQFKLNLAYFLSFYSQKSQQKTNLVYYQSLQAILLPEIRNYLEDYLKNPVNKNADSIYLALKAYLMLGDASHFDRNYIMTTIFQLTKQQLTPQQTNQLSHHLSLALNADWQPLLLDATVIAQTRQYLTMMPSLKLGYIILKNRDENKTISEINLGLNTGKAPVFLSRDTLTQLPSMFTAKAFLTIFSQTSNIAAQEAITGNWILGSIANNLKNNEHVNILADQLRAAYVTNYVTAWENVLGEMTLSTTKNLEQTDAMIISLISNDSPLLQLLQTLRNNTNFQPVLLASQKLSSLDLLIDKNHPSANLLYDIFSSLQSLHTYIQSVLTSDNEKKAAFNIITQRVKNVGAPDAVNQIRVVAAKSPEPLKSWLEKIANDTWYFLMQDAGRYLDTSWKTNVAHIYQAEIENRYPFSQEAEKEVDLRKFTLFFGKPGIITNFYTDYLQPFVDTTHPVWSWKSMDKLKFPFPDAILAQIQQATRIQHAFFPNGDNKLYVQFALQPYQFDKQIQRIKLSMNDKQIIDERQSTKNTHLFTWPGKNEPKMTSIQFVLKDQQPIDHYYAGEWGWFRLVNQTFESAPTTKQMLLNVSLNEKTAKYLLFTSSQPNPFMSLNLRNFHLPSTLTSETV